MLRRALNKRVLSGDITYRDSFAAMLKSIPLPFEECKQILKESECQQRRTCACLPDFHLMIQLLQAGTFADSTRHQPGSRLQKLLFLVQGEWDSCCHCF